MIQQLFEKALCHETSHYENMDVISVMRSSHHVHLPNQHFSLSAKMKEDAGKSMKNALDVLQCAVRAK